MRLTRPFQGRCAVAIVMAAALGGCAAFGLDEEREAMIDRLRADDMLQAAEVMYRDGNLDGAFEVLDEARTLAPRDARIYYRLGTIHYHKGQVDKAAKQFEKVLAIDTRNDRARFNLATIRLGQAEEHFKYFTATASPGSNTAPIKQLLQAVDDFAQRSEQVGKAVKPKTPMPTVLNVDESAKFR